jgi:hypothetical protein
MQPSSGHGKSFDVQSSSSELDLSGSVTRVGSALFEASLLFLTDTSVNVAFGEAAFAVILIVGRGIFLGTPNSLTKSYVVK